MGYTRQHKGYIGENIGAMLGSIEGDDGQYIGSMLGGTEGRCWAIQRGDFRQYIGTMLGSI
jgi:hypothetical protein